MADEDKEYIAPSLPESPLSVMNANTMKENSKYLSALFSLKTLAVQKVKLHDNALEIESGLGQPHCVLETCRAYPSPHLHVEASSEHVKEPFRILINNII